MVSRNILNILQFPQHHSVLVVGLRTGEISQHHHSNIPSVLLLLLVWWQRVISTKWERVEWLWRSGNFYGINSEDDLEFQGEGGGGRVGEARRRRRRLTLPAITVSATVAKWNVKQMDFFIYLFPHVHQLFLHSSRLLLFFFLVSTCKYSDVWVAVYLCVIKITLHVGAHDHSVCDILAQQRAPPSSHAGAKENFLFVASVTPPRRTRKKNKNKSMELSE